MVLQKTTSSWAHPNATLQRPDPAHLAKLLAPEIAVQTRHNDHLGVAVGGLRAEVEEVREELRLVYGDDLVAAIAFTVSVITTTCVCSVGGLDCTLAGAYGVRWLHLGISSQN